jgi:YVTN family beta-propeller protein
MQTILRLLLSAIAISIAAQSIPVVAQVVTATIPAGNTTAVAAVNPVTNVIHIVNTCGNDPTCDSGGTVTVLDGTTLATQTVVVGIHPRSVAVNPVTNKAYVVNNCGDDPACGRSRSGSVTVIDGATLNTQTVTVGLSPYGAAVNSVTNQIYVSNYGDGTVTVIDGATLSTQIVTVTPLPYGVAVNSATNTIYVADSCDSERCHAGALAVIDGATLAAQFVQLNVEPTAVAVNPATNTIYVINTCGYDFPYCTEVGNLSIVDGATLSSQIVNLDYAPYDLDVNPITNKIYVTNKCGDDPNCGSKGTVTLIDGATLSTQSISVGASPTGVRVNSVTNKTYVANGCGNDTTCKSIGTVSVIDGGTSTITPVPVGDAPSGLAINSMTNKVYVLNSQDATASIIAGDVGLQFVAITPCRIVDTRQGGANPIQGGTSEAFNLPQLSQSKGCGDLSSAAAYSLNVTAVPSGLLGYLTIWPTSERQPLVSTLNSVDGRVKANAAIVPAGLLGAVSVYATQTTNVVLDLNGYFTLAGSSTLVFYPLTPCRVADTRRSDFPPFLGTPYLSKLTERDFPVLFSQCGIPDTAQAYSLNFTAVPYPAIGYPLGYLEVWPYEQMPQHPVSTLNNPTGTIVANAAIVPAGVDGEIAVYPSNDTDLLIDVNGYFAPPGTGGLSLYPAVPCRVLDTRKSGSGEPFSDLLNPPVDVVDSVCGPATTAQAYVLNATVVPSGELGYLTLWQNDPFHKPAVSTLNAVDGQITNNMAIVPTTDGKIDAYANGLTQLILDLSSYFAP